MTTISQSSPKAKLLFVVTKSNWGGAQRYVYDLATNLPGDKFEVVVAAGGNGRLLKRLSANGLHTVEIPDMVRDINLLTDFRVFMFLLQLIKTENPQILHLNSSKAAILGSLAGRLRGVSNIVFTAHGWPFLEKRTPLSRLLIFIISWVTAMLVHEIITVSHRDAKVASFFPIVSKTKITMIHNGISSTPLVDRNLARMELQSYSARPIPTDDFWIGTVGELHKNKNQRILIDAIIDADLPNVRVLIIGDGEEYRSLKQYLERINATQTFYLLGHVEDAVLLLPALDLFVLPSTKEGFPYVLLEAGLAQLAVIASNVGGIPELLNHMKNGMLCNSSDSKELTSAVRLLARNSQYRKALSTALFKTVSNDFTLDQMIRRTECLY